MLHEEILRDFFQEWTGLGSTYAVIAYILTLELAGDRDSSRPLAVAGVINAAVVYSLKFLVARPRPGEVAMLTPSFPSGHAAMAFMVAGVLGERYPGLRYWLLALAATVAVSRIFLGLHFASDVVVGSVIGYGVGFLVARRFGSRSQG